MIKIIGEPVYLVTAEGTISSSKTNTVLINFQSSWEIENIQGTPTIVGKLGSILYSVEGFVLSRTQKLQPLSSFKGLDILSELEKQYLAELRNLNPSITFNVE